MRKSNCVSLPGSNGVVYLYHHSAHLAFDCGISRLRGLLRGLPFDQYLKSRNQPQYCYQSVQCEYIFLFIILDADAEEMVQAQFDIGLLHEKQSPRQSVKTIYLLLLKNSQQKLKKKNYHYDRCH